MLLSMKGLSVTLPMEIFFNLAGTGVGSVMEHLGEFPLLLQGQGWHLAGMTYHSFLHQQFCAVLIYRIRVIVPVLLDIVVTPGIVME